MTTDTEPTTLPVWWIRSVPRTTRQLALEIAHDYGITLSQVLTSAIENYADFTRQDRIAILGQRTGPQEARHRAPSR